MLTPDLDRRWVTSERDHVTGVGDQSLTIRFDRDRSVTLSGAEIDADHFDHAYALTVHRTQGATVETAHVLADGGGRELTYVAMSRARTTTQVHAVADSLDQARDDLTRDLTNDRRNRWIHDTDSVSGPDDLRRPVLSLLAEYDEAPTSPPGGGSGPDDALTYQHQAAQMRRRLDALQKRGGRTRDSGLGLG